MPHDSLRVAGLPDLARRHEPQTNFSSPAQPSEPFLSYCAIERTPIPRLMRKPRCWPRLQAACVFDEVDRFFETERNPDSTGCKSQGDRAIFPLPRAAPYETPRLSKPGKAGIRRVRDSGIRAVIRAPTRQGRAFRLSRNTLFRSGLPPYVANIHPVDLSRTSWAFLP